MDSDSDLEEAGLRRLQDLMGQRLDSDDPRAEFLRALGALGGSQIAEVMLRFSSGDSEIANLIANISNKEDAYIVLELLSELLERLLMMNGITAERVIPALRLAKAVVAVLEDPELQQDLELQLMACRCLYNFVEVNLDFVHDALNNHAVRALCQKLVAVEYIDLTEQALQTLEMMLRDPMSHFQILVHNGLACLSYLDFLTIHAQRKCMAIVANSCLNVLSQHFDKIDAAMESITQGVVHSDAQVVESAWQAISRIVISYRRHPRLLLQLISGLLPQMIEVMAKNLLVLKLVIICADLVELSRQLLVNNVGMGLTKDPAFLDLIVKLLPVQSWLPFSPTKMKRDQEREQLCRDIGPAYPKFLHQAWPIILETFSLTDADIRRKGLVCTLRVIRFGEWNIPDVALVVSLVSSVKGADTLRLGALETAWRMMEKYPHLVDLFEKEGFFNDLPVVEGREEGDEGDDEEVMDDESNEDEGDEGVDDDDEGDEDEEEDDVDDHAGEEQAEDTHNNESDSSSSSSSSSYSIHSPDQARRGFNLFLGESINPVIRTPIDPEFFARELTTSEINRRLKPVLANLNKLAPLKSTDDLDAIKHGLSRGEWQDLSTVLSYQLLGLIELLYPLDIPNDYPIEPLVAKLHELLDRVEPFEIVVASHNLAKQIKLRLILDQVQMTLSVHAIATFNTIAQYLSRIGFNNAQFIIGDEAIPKDMTIFGAVYRLLQTKEDELVDPMNIWVVHTIKFTLDYSEEALENDDMAEVTPEDGGENEAEVSGDQLVTPLAPALAPALPGTLGAGFSDISVGMPTFGVLNMLRKLYHLHLIDDQKFINAKLSRKLGRQLEEPLVVALMLPGWIRYLTLHFPFLFPVSVRLFYLQLTLFGYLRLIHHWQLRTQHDNDNGSQKLGRPIRQKVRILRKTMLNSAIKVLEMYGSLPGILEIEYFDEVGSGLGPTLEFYLSVLQEFSLVASMWRPQQRLFPSPVVDERGLFLFHTLGKFVGRAMLDLRLVDFNFNPGFLQLLLDGETNLQTVDDELARLLAKVVEASGEELADMGLTFTLPGFDDVELIEGGGCIDVNVANVREYVEMATAKTLDVSPQINLFKQGFSKVFPFELMEIFTADELCELFGMADEDWGVDTLESAIEANHGYTKDSPAIVRLIHVMSQFDRRQRRTFLQFLTGSPKLPIGGFARLRPRLTVVKKQAELGLPDEYLPSVMTCANYFKLPNYSSEGVMREKLLKAIEEGAGAFHLS